ncbi:DgyrCDS11737 [Dimorphilus gyrociliatus]|uniref:Poly [ADP-ribose] polymerase n=1 Tax=Dimorphilus gyrociliatus TaxID=2664684 RepID=A0A7I8W578_9ANNE|nr:DgyrCDS11737 [Dimorphilus gyrociliatus]
MAKRPSIWIDKIQIENVSNFDKFEIKLKHYLNEQLRDGNVRSLKKENDYVIATFDRKIDYSILLTSVRANNAPEEIVVRSRKNLFIQPYRKKSEDEYCNSDSDMSTTSTSSSKTRKNFKNKNRNSPRNENLSIDLSLSPHRLQLAKQLHADKIEGDKIIINGQNASTMKMDLLDALSKIVKIPANIPDDLELSNEGLHGLLRKTTEISYIDTVMIDIHNNIIAWNMEDVRKFQDYIKENITSEKSEISVDHWENNDKLDAKIAYLREKYKVCFSKLDKFIYVHGLNDSPKIVRNELEEYWKQNAKVQIIYKVENDLNYTVLKRYFKDDIGGICENSPIKYVDNLNEIQINGIGLNEKQIKSQLKQFSSNLAEEKLEKSFYGLKNYLGSEKFKANLTLIENNNCCVIDTASGNSTREIPSTSDNSEHQCDDSDGSDSDEDDSDDESNTPTENPNRKQIEIIAEKGNIVKYKGKVELLINNIASKDKNILKGGKLSETFVAEFPELKAVPMVDHDDYIASSKINEITICHANITKIDKRDAKASIRYLGNTIKSILEFANKIGAQTIALPPIGTGKICGFRESVVGNTILGRGKESTSNAKSQLQLYLSRICYTETLEEFKEVQWTDLKEIEDNYVKAKLDSNRGVLVISGIENYVERASMKAQKILMKVKQKISNEASSWDEAAKIKDKDKRLKRYVELKDCIPSNWKNFKSNSGISSLLSSDYYKVNIEKEDPAHFKNMKAFVESLWQSNLYGHGNDARSNSKRKAEMKIMKIHRIENKKVYEKFTVHRSSIIQDAISGRITEYKPNPEIQTRKRTVNDLIPEINECLLFHGAQKTVIDKIIKEGFDSRCSTNKGLYGDGLYFAEDPTKADQYVGDDSKGNILLCRVVMGNVFTAKKSMSNSKRGPCLTCQHEGTCLKHEGFYDSVVGSVKDGGVSLLFREFVIYESHLAYPEYVISYDKP